MTPSNALHCTKSSLRRLILILIVFIYCCNPTLGAITVTETRTLTIPAVDISLSDYNLTADYNASGCDTLVVGLSVEHNNGITFALNINTMKYNGINLVEAQQISTTPGTSSIFYLHSPGGGSGYISVQASASCNGGFADVYCLIGTNTSAPPSGGSSNLTYVDVTAVMEGDIIIAAILDGGQDIIGNFAVDITANSPLTEVRSGMWGDNDWATSASAYQFATAPGVVTSSFNTTATLRLRTVAATFRTLYPVTQSPSLSPSVTPTRAPSSSPTRAPSSSPSPTSNPTSSPTFFMTTGGFTFTETGGTLVVMGVVVVSGDLVVVLARPPPGTVSTISIIEASSITGSFDSGKLEVLVSVESNCGLSTGALAGIVVGAVVFLSLLALIIIFVVLNAKKRRELELDLQEDESKDIPMNFVE